MSKKPSGTFHVTFHTIFFKSILKLNGSYQQCSIESKPAVMFALGEVRSVWLAFLTRDVSPLTIFK